VESIGEKPGFEKNCKKWEINVQKSWFLGFFRFGVPISVLPLSTVRHPPSDSGTVKQSDWKMILQSPLNEPYEYFAYKKKLKRA
jgi:hypothetical protein